MISVTEMQTLRPGDLLFGPIGGFVPGAVPVGAGQVLLADRAARLSWRRWWNVRHVAMVVEASRTFEGPAVRYGDGTYAAAPLEVDGTPYVRQDATLYETGVITAPRIVQAMPSGAEEIDMSAEKHWTAGHVFVRPAYTSTRALMHPEIAAAARRYIGTPYGFATYVALSAAWAWPGTDGFIEQALARKITDRGEMICSQLADQALADAGFHVFNDGRLPQDVVPAELYRQLMAMPGTMHIHPGQPFWTAAASCSI